MPRKQVAERPVCAMYPSARGDAVRHVHEFVLEALVPEVVTELGKRFLLHDLGVDRCNTIDLVAREHSQARHAHRFLGHLLNDAEIPGLGSRSVELRRIRHEAAVDLTDELQVPRQQVLEQRRRPLFQSFRHDRVVCVVADAARQVPGLVPLEPLHIQEQAHELDDSHGRVRVVHLDGHLGGQFRPLAAGSADENAQQVLKRGADEQVLLLQSQGLALQPVVSRVEHRRQVLGLSALLDGLGVLVLAEGREVELFRRQ
mmetsp:Transcript_171189/g.548770  ORF Transcript_171189/g.548770 Transcript_171189/m.548770 type:complete len:258 (-) Transcript_171189:933-1706(-)